MREEIYSTIGAAIELNAASKYHQQFSLPVWINHLILPAIKSKQIKIYYSLKQKPVALVIWAWLSESVLESVCTVEDKVIEQNEWQCGSHLFFSDFIVPYGNTREIFNRVFLELFPDEYQAISLRRNMDGSIRKKNIWRRYV